MPGGSSQPSPGPLTSGSLLVAVRMCGDRGGDGR